MPYQNSLSRVATLASLILLLNLFSNETPRVKVYTGAFVTDIGVESRSRQTILFSFYFHWFCLSGVTWL